MKRLSEYSADRVRMTREGFLAKHPVPVLLHRYDINADESDPGSLTSHVSMLDPPNRVIDMTRAADPLAMLGLAGRASIPLDVVVFPIAKRSGAILHDRVSVGRNRNADIHLPFRRVSKFHAYFTSAPGTSKIMLTDGGSTNGTFVGGKRALTGHPVEISERGVIHFSQFLFVFMSAGGLYSFLSGE